MAAAVSMLLGGAAFGQNASPPGEQPVAVPAEELAPERELPPRSEGVRRVAPDAPIVVQGSEAAESDALAPRLEVPFLTGTIGWGYALAGLLAAAILAYVSRLGVRAMRKRATI